jgi:hypothetical protein
MTPHVLSGPPATSVGSSGSDGAVADGSAAPGWR